MKKLLFVLLTIASIPLFAQDVVVNDANAERRNLSGSFNAIQVSSGIELLLTQGNEESVAVSASDEKYLAQFKTEVSGGVLKIYYDSKSMIWNENNKKKLRAYVSFRTLESIKASSGSDVNCKSVLKLGNLVLNFSSGARFDGEVNTGSLEVSQSSGSEIAATGKTGNIKVDLSSGAIFKGYDLSAEYCEAKASSGGEVRITVMKELNARASSGGGVKYRGEAVIKDISVSSGGVVKKS